MKLALCPCGTNPRRGRPSRGCRESEGPVPRSPTWCQAPDRGATPRGEPAVAPHDESASAASGDDGCVGWGGLGVGGAASSLWDSSSPEPRRPSPWNHEDAFELSVSALDTRLGVGGTGFEKDRFARSSHHRLSDFEQGLPIIPSGKDKDAVVGSGLFMRYKPEAQPFSGYRIFLDLSLDMHEDTHRISV